MKMFICYNFVVCMYKNIIEILPFLHQLAPGKPSIVPQKGSLASIWLDYN
jgi:hypothetical protein